MALALYFLVYFLVAFVLRSWLTFRSTGINPLVLPSRDDAYGFVGRAFKAVIGCLAGFVLAQAWLPDQLKKVDPFAGLFFPWSEWIGWVLLVSSLIWTAVAQWQMGNSWRIGIDEKNPTTLVEYGLFSISRNPIFLAMRFNLLGLWLVHPHALTLSFLVAGELLMQIQVRLEETHLQALHGDRYSQYRQKVARWL